MIDQDALMRAAEKALAGDGSEHIPGERCVEGLVRGDAGRVAPVTRADQDEAREAAKAAGRAAAVADAQRRCDRGECRSPRVCTFVQILEASSVDTVPSRNDQGAIVWTATVRQFFVVGPCVCRRRRGSGDGDDRSVPGTHVSGPGLGGRIADRTGGDDCQDPLRRYATTFDFVYAEVRIDDGAPQPECPDLSAALEARGVLAAKAHLQEVADGYCGASRACTSSEVCAPTVSDLEIEKTGTSSRDVGGAGQRRRQCLVSFRLSAAVRCTCESRA